MGMSTGGGGGGPMAEINVTPLVDVMLVLLIIFMITAPLMSHKVQIKLPEATLKIPPEDVSRPITLAIKDNGEIFWNDDPISRQILESRLALDALREPQPQIDIRADKTTPYRVIAEVMKQAKNSGFRKIGFVATPER
jgi:biopolymer transport protein ExbD